MSLKDPANLGVDALDLGLFWHEAAGVWIEHRKHEFLAAASAGTCGKLSGFFTSKSFSGRQRGTVISKPIFKTIRFRIIYDGWIFLELSLQRVL